MEVHNISQILVLEGKKQVGSLAEETIVHKISAGENLTELLEKSAEEIINMILSLLGNSPVVLVLEDGNPEGIITKADILQFPRL